MDASTKLHPDTTTEAVKSRGKVVYYRVRYQGRVIAGVRKDGGAVYDYTAPPVAAGGYPQYIVASLTEARHRIMMIVNEAWRC